MLRRVRGVAVTENRETGDGRVIAPGATEWGDAPWPARWAVEDLGFHQGAIQLGTIDSLTRNGDEIAYTGALDDEIPEAAEMIRRMEAGSAPLGARFSVSIDPDNWEIELIARNTEDGEDAIMMVASGSGRIPDIRAAMVAEAGDPDPGDDGGDGGVVLLRTDSGAMLERTTRLRIRALTALDIGADDGAYMELDGDAETPAADQSANDDLTASVVDGAPALSRGLFPDRPPAEWFQPITDEPDGSLNITADGWVSGYIAVWGTCHTGYADRCVTPPREADYVPFHTGRVELEDGELIACGVLTWGIPHAQLSRSMIAAQEHYANSDAMFARNVVGANEWGIWHSGALRASLTRDDLADLRALALSGDWRWSQQTGAGLRLIAATAVNNPGFPVPFRSQTAAAGIPIIGHPDVFVQDGRVTAMTSAGMVAPVDSDDGHAGCSCQSGPSEELRILRALDRRTRHLNAAAGDALAASIRGK